MTQNCNAQCTQDFFDKGNLRIKLCRSLIPFCLIGWVLYVPKGRRERIKNSNKITGSIVTQERVQTPKKTIYGRNIRTAVVNQRRTRERVVTPINKSVGIKKVKRFFLLHKVQGVYHGQSQR